MKALLALFAPSLFSLSLLAGTLQGQSPDFIRAFDEAQKSSDESRMEAVVFASPTDAMMHFVALCWDQWRRPEDERLLKLIGDLKAAWGRAFDNGDAVDRVQRFVMDQTNETASRLQAAEAQLRQCLSELTRAEASGDRAAYMAVRDRAVDQASIFEALGDAMHASNAWGMVAQVLSRLSDRTDDEQAEMITALQRFVELRERWGWVQDLAFAQNVDFLNALQVGDAGAGVAVEAAIPELGSLVVSGVAERVFDLEFEMLVELEPDMFVLGGPVPTLWASVEIRGDNPERFPKFRRKDLFLVRPSVQRFGVTTDVTRSGRGNATTVRAESRPRPSLFYLDDDRADPYAMWFFTGGERERYMQAEVNLLPTRERAHVFYRSAASWTTSIDRTRVVFYDDDCDGKLFNPNPFAQEISLRTLGEVTEFGTWVPTYDSMRIGRGPRIPYSEATQIGGTWYRMRGVEDDTKVGILPLDPDAFETGEVQMNWRGNRRARPELLIIQGRDTFATTAFDISSGRPVEVPAGDYEVTFGRIVVGSGDRTQMAQIFKGESERFTVEAGERFSLEIGAPFRIEFVREGEETEVAIDASKMRVLGTSGEQYANLHGAVLSPEVVASTEPDGRGARVYGDFTPVVLGDLALIFAQRSRLLSLAAISFPRPNQSQGQRGDLVFRLRLPAAGMVVGLRQDRHPLFGELHAVFK